MEPYFSLKRWLTLWLLRLRFAGDTFSKKTQVSLKENKWGYLLLIIKSKLSSKDDKFGNLVVTSVSLRASHCLALESEIDGVVVVQSFSRVWFFGPVSDSLGQSSLTPWTAASQTSLFYTISRSLLKLMSTEPVMPSNNLLPPSPPAFTLSQHQGFYQWVRSSYQVAKVLELQRQSFQWLFRVDFL